jgi:hypothetical protein
MDPVLSTLFPTYKIGNDGFSWWIGQVENNKDIKDSGRIQVRIVGVHHKDGDVTGTEELPWAHVMMPANVPYSDGGTTGATNNLQIGTWVVGFYLDTDCQRPLVIGSIAHTQASTTKSLQDYTPDLTSLGFKATRATNVNPAVHRSASEQKGVNEQGAVTEGGVPAVGKSNQAKAVPKCVAALKGTCSETNPTGGKTCVEVADAECDSKDLGSGIKKIIGDLLKNNQQSGGQIGSYYIGQANGLLYSAIDIPRKYIDKTSRLITSFSLRIKKEIVYGIRQGVEALIKLIMGVQTAKEAAEKAKDKPLNPKESYVPNTERGNFLKRVIDTINKILNELGCSFTKTLDDLIKFVIDLIMEYLQDAFNAAFCLLDSITDKIIKFLESTFNDLISTVLGPLQDILGQSGSFLDIIGGVVGRVLSILGISCTGVSTDCNKDKTKCSDGGNEDKDKDNKEEEDFLDRLIRDIEEGSLTGNELGSVTRGVCNEAKTTPNPKPTKVKFIGGVPNKPITSDYIAVTTTIPDIPIDQLKFPEYTDLPNAVATPDATRSDLDQVEYKITAVEPLIKEGETARFEVVGPLRNGVLEIEVLSSSTIPSEANEIYEPCLIESGDGLATGFEVQVSRNNNGVPFVSILNGGRGYLVGMEFTLNGSRIGGINGADDIRIKITSVGELINYRIFGDVYDKNLIDDEIYPEFGSFTYTEPRSFSFPTIDAASNQQPSFIGLEFLQKRAADSVTIWDEEPNETFPEEQVVFSSVTLETERDVYLEGENVTYIVTTENYLDGTVFNYQIFGSVNSADYETIGSQEVITESTTGKFIISINIDAVKEDQEVLTVLLFKADTEIPVASKTITIVDNSDAIIDGVGDTFTLTSNTTQQQLEDYLNSSNITTTTDYGSTTVNLPPDLGALPDNTEQFANEPDTFEPPITGDPIVDTDGSIISIPVDYPGNRSYQIPPKVIISGEGYGAAGIALLDQKGFVSEIRVTRIGLGYVPNVPDKNGLQCVIDAFSIIRPGFGYETPPTVYVDGDPNIAQVTINSDGYIDGVKVLNRSKSYDTIPEILVVGGGGAGGFVLPSLVCLPPLQLEQKGYVKIGTGSYIDCP